ncbi:MAG: rRNA adenine N-6-methyltransferase family protein, partial [Halodesulfurarchaeum sp.]
RQGKPAVLTYQREVAERLVAEAGTTEYGRLSVGAQHYADVRIQEIIPPEAFDPKPAVESAIVSLAPREPDYDVPDPEAFFAIVKALFTQRRKTLRNAIRNTTHISGIEDSAAVIDSLPEPLLGKRPDAVSPGEFAHVATIVADVDG